MVQEWDQVTVVTILRLRSNCFLCQKPAVKVDPDVKSSNKSTWKQGCAEVISQSLGIGDKPICTVLFKRASYCDSCYELFCDLDFLQSSIQRLQKRMCESSEKVEQLIRTNFQDLTTSNSDKIGEEYVNAVRTIGRELGLEAGSHDNGKWSEVVSGIKEEVSVSDHFIVLNPTTSPSSPVMLGGLECDERISDGISDNDFAEGDPLANDVTLISIPSPVEVFTCPPSLSTKRRSMPKRKVKSSKRKRLQPPPLLPVEAAQLAAISAKFRRLAPLPSQPQLPGTIFLPLRPRPPPPVPIAMATKQAPPPPMSVRNPAYQSLERLGTTVVPGSSVTLRSSEPVTSLSPFGQPLAPLVSSPVMSTCPNPKQGSMPAPQFNISGSCLPTLLWIPGPMGGSLVQVTTAAASGGAVSNPVDVVSLGLSASNPEVIDIISDDDTVIITDGNCPSVTMDYQVSSGLKRKPKRLTTKKRIRPSVSLCCSQCQFKVGRKFPHAMAAHVRKVHENDPTPYHCADCDRRYVTYERLESHKSADHSDPIACPDCPDRTFKGKRNLELHRKLKHRPAPDTLKCQYCKKICPDDSSLRDHEGLHEDWNPSGTAFSCVLCSSVFPTEIQLCHHVRHRHEDDSRCHECEECGHKFFTRRSLSSHQSSCHGDSRFQCQMAGCSYATSNARRFRIHEKTHVKGKSFQCTWGEGDDQCRVKFKTKSSLTAHIAGHKLNDGLIEAKHTCSICSKRFVHTAKYLRHMRAESELRPFLCDKCPLRFKDQQSVTSHLWRHARNEGELGNDTEARRVPVPRHLRGDSTHCAVCDDTKNVDVVDTGAAVCRNCRWFFEYQTRLELTPSMVSRRKIEPCLAADCVMTPETRSECKECRLKKCRAVGLTLEDCLTLTRAPRTFGEKRKRIWVNKKRPKIKNPDGSDVTKGRDTTVVGATEGPCPVCGKTTRLVGSYGTHACANCKQFFAGVHRHDRVFNCGGNNDCSLNYVDWTTNAYCRGCRYRKCIQAGMKSEAIPTRKSENLSVCPVCEQGAELRSTYGVPACKKCCYNFWAIVRHNRGKQCPRNCKTRPACPGCKWKKYMRLGFQVEMICKNKTRRVYSSRTSNGPPDNCWVCGDNGRHRRGDGWACTSCVIFFDKFTLKVRENAVLCTKGGSCDMTILTRTDCTACRYSKCFSMGMRRNNPYKRRKPEPPQEPCAICGDIAAGYRYGVKSCDSCMYFFMKAVHKDVGECQGGGGCRMTKETRSKCQPCRLAKCLEQGMEKTHLAERQRGGKLRWGRIPKNSALAESLRRSQPQSQPPSSLVTPANPPASMATVQPQPVIDMPSDSSGVMAATDVQEVSDSDGVYLINVPNW